MHVNIDTIEMVVSGCKVKLKNAKTVTVTNEDGEILASHVNRIPIKGKDGIHELSVRTMRNNSDMLISGSPAAHQYGQNSHTTSDMASVLNYALATVANAEDFLIKDDDWTMWTLDQVSLDRVDVFVMLKMRDEKQSLGVTTMMSYQLIGNNKSLRHYPGTTNFCPGGGAAWLVRMYAKGLQCRQDPRSKSTAYLWRLAKENAKSLRIEVQVRRPELRKLGLDKATAWKDGSAEMIIRKYIKQLPLGDVTVEGLKIRNLQKLPAKVRTTYALHVAGYDLTQILQKRTLQIHRKELMRIGVDIRTPHQKHDLLEGESMKALIRPSKVFGPPQWLIDEGLCPPPRDE